MNKEMIKASICTIGDEILIGQIVDTNSSAISQELNKAGVIVRKMVSMADDHESIISTLSAELADSDIVIVTGGLGPTKDDITKTALAELSNAGKFVTNEDQLKIIENILSSRGLDMLDINRAQASVPDTCEVIVNHKGTAPVMVFRFPESRFGHRAVLYSLPGVPFEAIAALPEIISDIRKHHLLSDISHRTIMTYGIAESALSKLIENWEDNLPANMHLAYLPNALTGVRLRLSVYGGSKEQAEESISRELCTLKDILGELMYSDHEDTLQDCIGRILEMNGLTVSAAESCTGGMISQLITSVPGASLYFNGSVVSYSNQVKTSVLGVPEDIIAAHGAVSSQCVAAMAEGVRKLTGTDYAVATSGIAGPGGGSYEKPVGTVWIGVSSIHGTETVKLRFNSDRKRNIERFTSSALNLLRLKLKKELNH